MTEGNGTCSTRPCECEDLSWPRVDAGTANEPCWQCVHPPLDLTIRPGSSDTKACLADATGVYTVGSRLTSPANFTECGVFRYNGAVIASKQNNASCLSWVQLGQYWGLADCSAGGSLSKFQQHTPEETPHLEILCTRSGEDEFCVEPAEYMCTSDPTQCSMGQCRCEDPGLVRKEMQTITGGVCFTCVPPLPACSVSSDPSQCTATACECSTPGHVKVRHDSMSIVVGNETQSCFSCRAPAPASGGENWLSTFVIFVLCVLFGLCIGCGIRHLLPASNSEESTRTAHGRRQADVPRTWSERWAENVEDFLKAMCDLLSDNLGDALQWARPGWRFVKSKVGDALNAVDEAMDPLYCILDVMQERLQQQWEAFQARIASRKAQRAAKRAEAQASGSELCEGDREIHRPVPKESAVQRAANAVAAAAARREHEAAEAAEAEEIIVPDDIDWDPLNFTGRSRAQDGNGVNPMVMIPKEWMKLVAAQASGTGGMAGLAGAAANASAANSRQGVAASCAEAQPQQRRALKRLQQRREAASAKAAAAAVAAPSPEPAEDRAPIDESWIEEFECQEAAAKAKAEAKAAKLLAKKEKKRRNRGRDQPEKAQHKESPEPEAEDVDVADEDDEGDTAAGPACVAESAPVEEEIETAEEPSVVESSGAAISQEQRRESVQAMQHLLLLSKHDETPSSPTSTAKPDHLKGGASSVRPRCIAADADLGAGGASADVGAGCTTSASKKPKSSAQLEQKDRRPKNAVSELAVHPVAAAKSQPPTDARFIQQSHISKKPWRQQQRASASEMEKSAAESDASDKSLVAPADAGAGARSKTKASEVKSTSARTHEGAERQEKSLKATPAKAAPKQRGGAPETVGQPGVARCKAPVKDVPRAVPASKSTAPLPPSEPSPAPWRKAAAKAQTTHSASTLSAKAAPAVPEPAPVPSKGSEASPAPEPQEEPVPPSPPKQSTPEGLQKACEPAPGISEAQGPAAGNVDMTTAVDSSSDYAAEQDAPVPAASGLPSSSGEMRPKSDDEAEAPTLAADVANRTTWLSTSKPLAADAPDFVPLSMMQPKPSESVQMEPRDRGGRKGKKGRQQHADQLSAAGDSSDLAQSVPITTMMISGIQAHHTPESFRQQMDSWGLLGTYNFFFMPSDKQTHLTCGYAFINFIDPTFATLCQWLFQQYQFEGAATPFQIQGLESNIAHWNQFADDHFDVPVIIPTPTPSQWAVNGVNLMLNSKFSPQIREQFHKTKMCVFFRKNKCALGMSCPFAHTKEELQPPPDLAKTKLCYNFFRRRCNDSKCKFAHGYQELRATETVYKTELCRWWSAGGCKAGGSCRYAHGVEELRVPQMEMPGGFPFMPPEGFMEGEDGDMFPAMVMPAMPIMQVMPDIPVNAAMTGQQSLEVKEEPAADPEPSHCDDFASDVGFSDTSTLLAGNTQLLRQSTAPAPASSYHSVVPPLTERSLNEGAEDILLRVKGTFMEAVHVESSPAHVPIHRSWSDGDLPQLRQVMEGMESGDDE